MDGKQLHYGRNRISFYVISIEFLSPQKCKCDWVFELKISPALHFYNLRFVIIENCGIHFYHTKYTEDDNKIARIAFFTPHISSLATFLAHQNIPCFKNGRLKMTLRTKSYLHLPRQCTTKYNFNSSIVY